MIKQDSTAKKVEGQDRVFKLFAERIQDYIETKPAIDEVGVKAMIEKELAKSSVPRVIEVRTPDKTVKLKDRAHCQFEELLGMVNEGHQNLLMVGPAGSGKTMLARSLAEALGRTFGFISLSAGISETHLFGRLLPQADGSWQYNPSQFVEIYEKGGVFLLDEIDAADANVMVAINAALANGVLANPNGRIHHRHKDTIVIGAANTWGRGADTQYVGRNQLDAATLDRFVLSTVMVDYDTKLEKDLANAALDAEKGGQLIRWVWDLRKSITQHRLRRIASTRLVVNAIAAMKAGRTLDSVRQRYMLDWSDDEKAKLK